MRRKKKNAVALLVDSSISSDPSEFLTKLRPLLEEIGDIKVGKIVILQKQAIEYSKIIGEEGFIPVIVHDDLDIYFALEASCSSQLSAGGAKPHKDASFPP